MLAGLGALVGVVWLAVAETTSHADPTAKLLPARGPEWSPDLGPDLAAPTAREVVAVREGPGTAFERGRLDALLGRHRATARPTERLTPELLAQQLADVEQYIVENPDGEFTPGLRVELGQFYRGRGRYSKALEHWRAAWVVCAPYGDGNGKLLADRALVRLCTLLQSLGRVEELTPLITAHQFRVLADPAITQTWVRTCEAFAHLRRQPELAYRCGPLALFNVARRLDGSVRVDLRHQASPETGFSLAQLQTLADTRNLGLITAFRERGRLPVPAVVHWREDHYAAVVTEQDGQYLVEDPTFKGAVWMDGETLFAEASGYFLIAANLLPDGWRRVTAQEAAGVFGKGWPDLIDDEDGPGCGSDGGGGGGRLGGTECCEDGGGGSGTGSGTNACGMAAWRVHEPNLNLEVWDIPLHYRAAYGPDFVLKLQWRQRNTQTHNWTKLDDAWQTDLIAEAYYPMNVTTGEATMTTAAGDSYFRRLHFPSGSSVTDLHHLTGSWAKRTVVGSDVTRIDIHHRNGSVETFEPVAGNWGWYHIVSRADATGKAMTFAYDSYWQRLSKVTLADGTEFDFAYADTGRPNRITSISGPNGRTVSFA